MYIETNEELFEYLDKDLAWRKKELSSFKSNVSLSPTITKSLHIRVGITFLYAHWQGYIGNAGNFYINYIKNQNLNYNELNDNLITLALRNKIKVCWNTTKTKVHYELINTVLNDLSSKAPLPHKNAIDPTSNLNYDILEDVLFTLGLDVSPYQVKKNLIDYSLLECRGCPTIIIPQHQIDSINRSFSFFTQFLNFKTLLH